MYIQITTRCNMRCAHCLFACTARGVDMSTETFRRAVDLANGSGVIIGGGEPTLHPEVLELIDYAATTCDLVPMMVTNGAMSVLLWRELLARHLCSALDLYVSKDPWHDSRKVPAEVKVDAMEHGLWRGAPADRPVRTIALRGRARSSVDRLVRDALGAGYRGVRLMDSVDGVRPRVDPAGDVHVDVGIGARLGPLSADVVATAESFIAAGGCPQEVCHGT